MKVNLESLATERRNERTQHIDEMSTLEMLRIINEEDQKVPLAVACVLETLAKAVDAAYERMKTGGRLIYIGAGTSGRLGILDASECPPTYGVSPQLVQGIIAGGEGAIHKALEGAEDDEEQAVMDLKQIDLQAQDIVCGLAASGRTPYVKAALVYAKQIGALTISVCCVHPGDISSKADIPLEVIVGPEVVTGSTRMKAGTAQKLILNMLSTGVMIRLGKVYGNLMVDVAATNEKLVERARNIIKEAAGCTYEEASILFEASDRDVKTAIIMHLCHKNKIESQRLLSQCDGVIAKAVLASKGGN